VKQTHRHFKFFPGIVIIGMLLLSACTNNDSNQGNNDGSNENTSHPKLLLSSDGAGQIKSQLGNNELLDISFATIERDVVEAMEAGISVPVPKDPGGGYTHELHKRNGILLYESGLLFQITNDEKYARYSREMLLEYAKLYPTLDVHPARKENAQTPGILFWQGLNDCMWLVYGIQGYDLIYNWLSAEDRKTIEEGAFLPMAEYLSEGCSYTFNRIHNHGTWAVAAVGMTGYVLGNDDLVEKSLKGLAKDGNGGFLAQLDKLFSPNGYYTEGPYYQRFAMLPFIVFAEAIQKNDPELGIFAYNDSILHKATNISLQLTYTNGAFFPINDAIKDKTYETVEMVYAANIDYANYGQNPGWIDIAERQGRVTLTDAGLSVALGWKEGKKQPFDWTSMFLADGAKGDEGGIGIFRAGPNDDQSCLLMKYTSHGLSHGHYDKLGFLYYNNNVEIIRDYGAARFLNIAAKFGGRYLPENTTWANQSIAHNTLTVDETTHFNGEYDVSSQHNPTPVLFSVEDKELQYMSAVDVDAYPGIEMYRTMVLAEIPTLEQPVVLDVFKVSTSGKHQYDLPYYYNGQYIGTNFPVEFFTDKINALGKNNGYQHLWLKGKGKSETGMAQVTFLTNNRFYTLSALTDKNTEILFTSIGANDPDNNLRNEPAVMLRQKNTGNHIFVGVLEPHGAFDPIAETTKAATSRIENISISEQTNEQLTLILSLKNGESWELKVPNNPNSNEGSVTLKKN
jgi:hypothetical protein